MKSNRDADIISDALTEIKGDLELFDASITRDFGKREKEENKPSEIIRRLIAKEATT